MVTGNNSLSPEELEALYRDEDGYKDTDNNYFSITNVPNAKTSAAMADRYKPKETNISPAPVVVETKNDIAEVAPVKPHTTTARKKGSKKKDPGQLELFLDKAPETLTVQRMDTFDNNTSSLLINDDKNVQENLTRTAVTQAIETAAHVTDEEKKSPYTKLRSTRHINIDFSSFGNK